MRTRIICCTGLAFILVSCGQEQKKEKQKESEQISKVQVDPDELKQIQIEFPGALSYAMGVDSLLHRLAGAGITADQILWGESICVDDITNTKNKVAHPEIKGPFTFGGLGGLPFTGITGIDAFSHHVPENGTAVLFVGPHIGFRNGEWGKILRHGQEQPSTCCGALVAALSKLQKNQIVVASPQEEDYQQHVLEQLALKNKDSILNAKNPLIAFTRIVANEAEKQITSYVKKANERHFAYAVIVVGVIINTDYQHPDFLWVDHVGIKDLKKNEWIKI